MFEIRSSARWRWAARRRIIVVYLVLLAVSNITSSLNAPPPLSAGMSAASVQVVKNERQGSRRIRLGYRDTGPSSTLPPVVLIHGSPGSGAVFDQLTEALTAQFRVIVPDLPGFGESTRDIPDYSFRSHAHYLLQLLDQLQVPSAQLVGFSMGGGVALSMVDLAPERVSSIVMLAAIGVQEQELTGSYELNHMLHGLQLAALWAARYAVPHFGLFGDVMLNLEYARNFYDSDQRPLRSILMRYSGPMLIVHGSRDPLVPLTAAREHHRIVPQSEFVVLDENHFIVFQRPWVLTEQIRSFLVRVNKNEATTRAGTKPSTERR